MAARRPPSAPALPLPGDVVCGLVRRIPRGHVATYGTIGRAAAMSARPIGGARTVAWILAALKGTDTVPWHRVVGAGGRILLPDRRGATQRSRLRQEGVPFKDGVVAADRLVSETVLLRPSGRRSAAVGRANREAD